MSANHRPTPLSPAGNATTTRGWVPERSTRCAALSPLRKKAFKVGGSSMEKFSVAASEVAAGSAAEAEVLSNTLAVSARPSRFPDLDDGEWMLPLHKPTFCSTNASPRKSASETVDVG